MTEVNWLENTELTCTEFMSKYWRQRPAVFKGGLESTANKLSKELIYKDIVELASSEFVESRTIQQEANKFQLAFGPFSPTAIEKTLSDDGSMLMVQGADQHVPALNALLTHHFSFIPRWRIEDIMVTIGGKGASCGPHFDHYDVFLFQLDGEKNWQWDACRHEETELDLNSDLRLLPSFDPEFSQTMGAGDILYLPPGAGHWGIAGQNSMTLSIGIRNPTMLELVSNYTDELLDDHLTSEAGSNTLDDKLDPSTDFLSGSMINALQSRYLEFVSNRKLMAQWFGRYMTELKEPALIQPMTQLQVDSELIAHRLRGAPFQLTLPTRMTHQKESEPLHLFLNGEVFSLNATCVELVTQLSRFREVTASMVFEREENVAFMQLLMLNGAIQFMEAVGE